MLKINVRLTYAHNTQMCLAMDEQNSIKHIFYDSRPEHCIASFAKYLTLSEDDVCD